MPLLNGQAAEAPAPVAAQAPGAAARTQGWEIRFTGEVFTEYDKYLERIAYYRKRVWTCKESGQGGLTFEQAQQSERAFRHGATGIGFSDMLVCEMLTFLSQSSLPISQAVDALFYRFQYDFFAGEHIDVRYPGTDGEMYECFVVAVHPLPPPMGSFTPQEEVTVESPTKVAIERLGDSAERLIAFEQRKMRLYTVRLFDVDGNAIDDSDISVAASELGRSRNVFTKVALRQFLDDHMRRDPRPGSPWIVLPQWRDRFRIPYMFGGEACLLRASKPMRRISNIHNADTGSASEGTVSPAAHGRKKNIVVDPYADERDPHIRLIKKFPVDDLELVNYRHVKWTDGIVWALRRKHQASTGQGAVANGSTHKITDFFALHPATGPDADNNDEEEMEEGALQNRWPVPLSVWQVPAALVPRMLAAYMFVSFFSAPLELSAYSLDFFETALMHSPADDDQSAAVTCSVFRDTVVALLNSLIEDRKHSASLPATVSARIEALADGQKDGSDSMMDVDSTSATNSSRVAKSRLAHSTSIADDSAAQSSNSEDDESGATSSATLDTKQTRLRLNGRRRRAPASRQGRAQASRKARGAVRSRESAASSVAATPADSDDDESVAVRAGFGSGDAASLSGAELLQWASRAWAESVVDKTRDGWAWRLVGWIGEAQHDYAELQPIYAALSAENGLTADRLERILWADALGSAEQRLAVLELLIGESANNETMRAFIEQCAESTAELKRERVELRREHRRVTERLAELDREDESEQQGSSTTASVDLAAAGSSRAQGRKEKEQSVQRQKERRKLGETERQTQRRLDYVDREIRRNNVARLAPLGTDRFFNKYYFIDGIGGCPVSNGSGRILVQPASPQERKAVLANQPPVVATAWALEMPPPWSNGLECRARDRELLQLSFPEFQNPTAAAGDDPWGYYATPNQIDALKRWLDTRGRRDATLLGELDLLQTAIYASVRRRCHVLERSLDARVRVRDSISDQVGALILNDDDGDDAASDSPEVVRLRDDLARIDRVPVPQALLPPQMLADQQQQCSSSVSAVPSRPSESNGMAESSAVSVCSGDVANADASSRASSVEPSVEPFAHQASLHASARKQGVLRPTRGRRPKVRVGARPKTFVDDFLAYKNDLLK
ncbi:hypothetical protein EV175_001728 [Coemansia sp. RSA 1933]|nr:hypothetical protein EV175_001728 [Coemansia sp. RSA 1933]